MKMVSSGRLPRHSAVQRCRLATAHKAAAYATVMNGLRSGCESEFFDRILRTVSSTGLVFMFHLLHAVMCAKALISNATSFTRCLF